MTVAENHDASDIGERPTWAWPVQAVVAWLARLFTYIANFKRARRFKPDWRDSWQDLRECEWLRDQLIAQGIAQLLSNQPVHLDDTKIQLEPPATYGGPCPRTPFDMNRCFLAIAQWAADPEAIIRERHKRIVRAAHGSTYARSVATHEAVRVATIKNAIAREALMLSSTRSARPSSREGGLGVLTKARGPPSAFQSLTTYT